MNDNGKLQWFTIYITMEIAPSHCNISIEATTGRGYFHSNIDSRVKACTMTNGRDLVRC